MTPAPELLKALNAVQMLARSRAQGRTPLVGVAGPQGSGKTTLVQHVGETVPTVAAVSLDDFYLTRRERLERASAIHPRFATRGPPGTHDVRLLNTSLDSLLTPGAVSLVPVFNKVADDREPMTSWRSYCGELTGVLVDGWCVGARHQPKADLTRPVNRLEAEEDAEGTWRLRVNRHLREEYAQLFARFDAMLYLRPPSFEVVFGWRCEQEEGLLGRPLDQADRDRIARFIQHYERITRHMIAGGVRADVVVDIDEKRRVTAVRTGDGSPLAV